MSFNTTLRTKITEEHLTCMICFSRFNQPKALPCLHTFCLGCLRDYVVGRNYEDIGTFPCPVCRKDIQIPPEGVQGFQANHIIASLLDTVEEAKKQPVPQKSSQEVIDDAQQGQGMVSPAQGRVLPAPPKPPRTMAGSQTPQVPQHQSNASPAAGIQPQQRPTPNLSTLIQDGIGGAVGHIGSALSDISTYLYSPNQNKADSPISPFELVDKSGEISGQSGPPGLYPQLSIPEEYKGPCTKDLALKFGKYGAAISDFLKPYGLAVGKNGEFVISDRGGSRIFVFSNSGEQKSIFKADCLVNGIAVTKDNHILIAVSKSGTSIMRMFTMEGKFIQAFGQFYRYDIASGIVVTPANHVAITNLAADNVLVFTDQRKFSVKFGSKGTGDKHFLQPQFIASTSKDYIVVSDTGNNCIKIYDMLGNFKRTFGAMGDNHGQLNKPLGITTDSEDNIIIADSENFRVEIYNVKGHFYTTLVKDTNLIGPDVKPINVAMTPRNNVAVLLFGTGFAEVRVYSWRPSISGLCNI